MSFENTKWRVPILCRSAFKTCLHFLKYFTFHITLMTCQSSVRLWLDEYNYFSICKCSAEMLEMNVVFVLSSCDLNSKVKQQTKRYIKLGKCYSGTSLTENQDTSGPKPVPVTSQTTYGKDAPFCS